MAILQFTEIFSEAEKIGLDKANIIKFEIFGQAATVQEACPLYTSDAADE